MKTAITLSLVVLQFCLSALSAQTWPLSENRWGNPDFVERFLGSYGVRSANEPTIGPEEKALFESLAPMIANEPFAAIQQLREATTTTSSAALDFTLGTLLLQEGQPTEARRWLQSAIRKFPNFLRAYRNLALLEIQADNIEQARPLLIKAIELGERDAQLYGLLGYTWLILEKPGSALTAYRQALLLEPESEDWQSGLAQALLQTEQYPEAIGILEEMSAASPLRADLWQAQANAWLSLGNNEKAATALESMRRMGVGTPQGLALLGDIYLNQGLHALALRSYQEALGRPGELPAERMLRAAKAFLLGGQSASAKELIDTVEVKYADMLSDDDRAELLFIKAHHAQATGDNATARDQLDNLLATDPLHGEALLLLADLVAPESPQRAKMLLERARQLPDFAPRALLQMAEILVAENQFREAAQNLREAQELQPRANVARYLEQVEAAIAVQSQ